MTKSNRAVLFFVLTLTLTLLAIFFWQNSSASSGQPTILLSPKPTKSVAPAPESNPNSPGLSVVVKNSLAGTYGTYAVVIKNLRTQESYSQNAHRQFASGSLYKLWLMGTVLEQIDQGKLSPETTLSANTSDLEQYFGLVEPFSDESQGEITLTVDEALLQTITISANYPALLLTKQVGLEALSLFLQGNNLSESTLAENDVLPQTSAADTASLLEIIYFKKAVSPAASEKMLDLLRWQKLNDKIPKYLPSGTTVGHKTGELDSFSHDAGIVFSPGGDYLFVVLSESDSPDLASERIATLSRNVYFYFQGQAN